MFAARRTLNVVRPCLCSCGPNTTASRALSQGSLNFKENIQKLSVGISSLTNEVFQHMPSSESGKDVTRNVLNRMRGSILELMAKSMSKKDQEYLLIQWGSPKEKKNPDDLANTDKLSSTFVETSFNNPGATLLNKSSVSEPESVSKTESESPSSPEAPHTITTDTIHPIFGQLLADVGYKKVYLTSARRLVLAEVWEKQRTLRPERSAGIAQVSVNCSEYEIQC